MRRFVFTAEQRLAPPPEELFAFFADAGNLERITPPWLRFAVDSQDPPAMGTGTIIRYRLRWRGIPLGWTTRIEEWDPPRRFVDRQLRGPYRLWVHEHVLEPAGTGSNSHDRVTYAVPGGRLVQRLIVGRDVDRIFTYRRQVLAELFGG